MDYMQVNRRDVKFDAIIAALLLTIVVGPYFVWFIKANGTLMLIVRVLFALLCWHNSNVKKRERSLAVFFGFTVVYYILIALLHGTININGIISRSSMLLYTFVFFTNAKFTKKTFDYFFTIFASLLAISLIVWPFALAGAISPYTQLAIGENERIYNIYPMLVMEPGYDFFRFYGPFDEPGVIGTIGSIALCIKRFSMKDWKNWVVVIAGVFSFSLFFYVLVVIYVISFSVFVKKRYILSLIFAAAFGLFYIATRNNDVVYELMWKRMEWNADDKKFEGDTRVNTAVDVYYDKIKGTPAYYFGVDNIDAFWNEVGESASYKIVVVTNGMIFLVLYISFFIVYAWEKKVSRNEFMLFCFVLLGNTYQRPGVYSIIMLFLFSMLARNSLIEKQLYLTRR